MRLQKLSLWGNGKAMECWQIHICLRTFSNPKTTSRLGHLVTHKHTRNINKMIKPSKTMGGSQTEPMRTWHTKKLWGKFEFKEKVGNSKLIKT